MQSLNDKKCIGAEKSCLASHPFIILTLNTLATFQGMKAYKYNNVWEGRTAPSDMQPDGTHWHPLYEAESVGNTHCSWYEDVQLHDFSPFVHKNMSKCLQLYEIYLPLHKIT